MPAVTFQVDEEKEAEELLPTFSMKRVLRINSPEWLYLIVGCLFSIIVGAIQPGLAFMMSEFLNVSIKLLCTEWIKNYGQRLNDTIGSDPFRTP